MKFEIDSRYIAIQTFKMIVGYVVALLIVFCILDVRDKFGFVLSSLCAGILYFFLFISPKSIIVKDRKVSFVRENSWKRIQVSLYDIAEIEMNCKFYNTVILVTRSGEKYNLHPKDPEALKNCLSSL